MASASSSSSSTTPVVFKFGFKNMKTGEVITYSDANQLLLMGINERGNDNYIKINHEYADGTIREHGVFLTLSQVKITSRDEDAVSKALRAADYKLVFVRQ